MHYKFKPQWNGGNAIEKNNQELFEKCLKQVLKWEGGYVNNPNDLGGATNKGITQNTYNIFLKNQGKNPISVKLITDEEVKNIYKKNYWDVTNCDNMTPKFAALCFDTAVNMGPGRVKEFLKRAGSIEEFIRIRKLKYEKFAGYGNQRIFLKGWMNRVQDLEKFIAQLSES